jgi:hypothetical protein
MSKCLVCTALLWAFLGSSVQAQEKPSRWSVGIAAGAAFPAGEFAGYHNVNSVSGGVNPGESAELSGQYRVCGAFNAILAFSGQLNHGNGIPLQLRNPREQEPTPTNNTIWNDWQIVRVLTGGAYTIPLGRGGTPGLFVRVLAGIQRVRTPDYTYEENAVILPGYSNPPVTESGAVLSWVFSYETDAGVRWKLSERAAFLAYAGYSGGQRSEEAPMVITIPPNNYVSQGSPPKGYFATGNVQIRAGLTFGL